MDCKDYYQTLDVARNAMRDFDAAPELVALVADLLEELNGLRWAGSR